MPLDGLQRIQDLRSQLASRPRWSYGIFGASGAGKRTAAAEILGDVRRETSAVICVVTKERGIARFAHLLRANGIETRQLEASDVREMAASFERFTHYDGVFLVLEAYLYGTIGSSALKKPFGLVLFDDPEGISIYDLLSHGSFTKIDRTLWLSTHEPSNVGFFDGTSMWPALHVEYAKAKRKLHIYELTREERVLYDRLASFLASPGSNASLAELIVRSATSSNAALEYELLRALSGDIDMALERELMAMLEALGNLVSDAKFDRLETLLAKSISYSRRALVLSANTNSLDFIEAGLGRSAIKTHRFEVSKELSDADIVLSTWSSLKTIDAIGFDDVFLCDLPDELGVWNHLQTKLLRPPNRSPVTVHAFTDDRHLDAHAEDLLDGWKFRAK